jgi:hypothetical protein
MRWRLVVLAGVFLALAIASQFKRATVAVILSDGEVWLLASGGSATVERFKYDNMRRQQRRFLEPEWRDFRGWWLWHLAGPSNPVMGLTLPIWNLATAAGLASIPCFLAKRRLSVQPGQCRKCKYMMGAAGVCPECGLHAANTT